MTKRRKLAPKPQHQIPLTDRSDDAGRADPDPIEPSKVGGFWGGSAVNLLQKKLDSEMTNLSDRVLQGLVVVELDHTRVVDKQGSDRQDDWKSEENLKSLIDDIRRRGQNQPIQVRPRDDAWLPNSEDPLNFGDTVFVVQSGRRRLESCRFLGIKVKAIINTGQSDTLRLDLEERFLENTVRRDLSAFEELLSVGLIARARDGEEQKTVADELHTTPSDVSLGLACLEFFDMLLAEHDVNSLAKRDFRRIIPEIRRKVSGRSDKPKPSKLSPSKPVAFKQSHGRLSARTSLSKSGFSMAIKGWKGDEDQLRAEIDAFLRTLSSAD